MEIEKQIADDDRFLIGKETLKAENERTKQQLLEKIAENNLIANEINSDKSKWKLDGEYPTTPLQCPCNTPNTF